MGKLRHGLKEPSSFWGHLQTPLWLSNVPQAPRCIPGVPSVRETWAPSEQGRSFVLVDWGSLLSMGTWTNRPSWGEGQEGDGPGQLGSGATRRAEGPGLMLPGASPPAGAQSRFPALRTALVIHIDSGVIINCHDLYLGHAPFPCSRSWPREAKEGPQGHRAGPRGLLCPAASHK